MPPPLPLTLRRPAHCRCRHRDGAGACPRRGRRGPGPGDSPGDIGRSWVLCGRTGHVAGWRLPARRGAPTSCSPTSNRSEPVGRQFFCAPSSTCTAGDQLASGAATSPRRSPGPRWKAPSAGSGKPRAHQGALVSVPLRHCLLDLHVARPARRDPAAGRRSWCPTMPTWPPDVAPWGAFEQSPVTKATKNRGPSSARWTCCATARPLSCWPLHADLTGGLLGRGGRAGDKSHPLVPARLRRRRTVRSRRRTAGVKMIGDTRTTPQRN